MTTVTTTITQERQIMNKVEFVSAVAGSLGVTKTDAAALLDAVFSEMEKALIAGDTVTLTGIAKLVPTKKPARTGRNPKTGATITIAEKTVVKLRTLSALKAKLV